jgi:hypothetical protein
MDKPYPLKYDLGIGQEDNPKRRYRKNNND